MNLPLTASFNEKGRLTIGGCDTVELAHRYGTPLYVLDEDDVRSRCRHYAKAFREHYPDTSFVYASKALSTVQMIKFVTSEGFGVDVASGGELYTALKAGMDRKKIFFHGSFKTDAELREAMTAGVGRIVIDNQPEIARIDSIAGKLRKKVDVSIRVNPGVDAHTHESIKTGNTDSKFGIPAGKVLETAGLVTVSKNLELRGLHAHIGSQIFDPKGYLSEIDALIDMVRDIRSKLKVEIPELNIGGGIGVAYVDGDDPDNIDDFAAQIASRLKEKTVQYKLPAFKLVLEPGRSIVARAGVTLYTVGHIKEIPGIRKFAVVDGGMSDNIRPMLYGAKYDMVLADDIRADRTMKVTVAGRACESGDVLAKDIMMPLLEAGSIIAVLCTGAYNYSMASNYNRFTRPAMVSVRRGRSKLIIRREKYKDVAACDAD